MAPPRVYRGALIGSGGIARNAHVPAFRQVRDRVELVALVDSAENTQPIEGAPLPMLRHREELEQYGPIDFIDICTPTASHLELVLWGLERGYDVLCEKPVALSGAEVDRIAAAARAHGRVVMPCHQYRYNPAWLQVRQWLRDDQIGHWHLAEFAVYRQFADWGSGPGSRPDALPWRGESAASRGGVLLDHGTHVIYQILDVAGTPAAVRAWTGRLRHQRYDVEDTAALLLVYRDRIATIFLTWAARHRENRIRFIGETGTIEWVGGELRLERDGRDQRCDFTRELDKASYWRWYVCLFQDFIAALDARDGEPFLQDIARVADVLEQAYQVPHQTPA